MGGELGVGDQLTDLLRGFDGGDDQTGGACVQRMQDGVSGYLADTDQGRQTGALRGRDGGGHKIGSERLMFGIDDNKSQIGAQAMFLLRQQRF